MCENRLRARVDRPNAANLFAKLSGRTWDQPEPGARVLPRTEGRPRADRYESASRTSAGSPAPRRADVLRDVRHPSTLLSYLPAALDQVNETIGRPRPATSLAAGFASRAARHDDDPDGRTVSHTEVAVRAEQKRCRLAEYEVHWILHFGSPPVIVRLLRPFWVQARPVAVADGEGHPGATASAALDGSPRHPRMRLAHPPDAAAVVAAEGYQPAFRSFLRSAARLCLSAAMMSTTLDVGVSSAFALAFFAGFSAFFFSAMIDSRAS